MFIWTSPASDHHQVLSQVLTKIWGPQAQALAKLAWAEEEASGENWNVARLALYEVGEVPEDTVSSRCGGRPFPSAVGAYQASARPHVLLIEGGWR